MYGAASSVISYNRISRAIVFIARRALSIPVDSYSDDFHAAEPEESAESGCHYFEKLSELIGTECKAEKKVAPSGEGTLLGATVDVTSEKLRLAPTESRLDKVEALIGGALDADRLTPTDAGSLHGKSGFLCTTLHG